MENLQKLSLDIMNNHSYEYVFANQYDVGRTIEITITDDDEPMELTGVEAHFKMLKPNNEFVERECVVSGSTVTFVIDAAMTAYPGKSEYQIILHKDGVTISTIRGTMIVENAAVVEGTPETGSESSMWDDIITRSNATEYYSNIMQAWIETGDYDGSHGMIWLDDILFSQLPVPTQQLPIPAGSTYRINEPFITTSAFEGGAGVLYPAGTNVCWSAAGKWVCLSGIQYHQNAATVPPSNGALLWGETYTPIIDDVTAYMAPTYSITERRVGTWIDGSDVYEKTIDLGSFSVGSWSDYTIESSTSIDLLIDYDGYMVESNIMYALPDPSVRIKLDSNKNLLFTGTSSWNVTSGYLTIRYTKPTTNNSSSNSESSQEGE